MDGPEPESSETERLLGGEGQITFLPRGNEVLAQLLATGQDANR